MSKFEDVKIRGRCRYAKVHKAVPTFDKKGTEWSIDIEISKEQYDEIMSKGVAKSFKLRTASDDPTFSYVKLKRPTVTRTGEPALPVSVVTSDRVTYTGPIGNGSEVIVLATIMPSSPGGMFGRAIRLSGVQVLHAVRPELDAESMIASKFDDLGPMEGSSDVSEDDINSDDLI